MVVGTLAEELVLNSKQLVKVPSTLTYSEASGFLVGYQTAYHGWNCCVQVVQRLTSSLVTRGYTKKGDYVLITGAAGGMGIAAIQVAKVLFQMDVYSKLIASLLERQLLHVQAQK